MLTFSLDFKKLLEPFISAFTPPKVGPTSPIASLSLKEALPKPKITLPQIVQKVKEVAQKPVPSFPWEKVPIIGKPIAKAVEFLQPPSVALKAQEKIARGGLQSTAVAEAKQEYLKEQAGLGAVGFLGGMEVKTENIVSNYLKSKVSTTLEKQPITLQRLKEGVYSGFNKLYTATVDRFNPINKIARKGIKTGQILPGENPELLARRYLGVKSIVESKLFWKTTELTPEGNLKITGEGLSNILKPVKNNLDDLRVLMIAERDLELVGRGITKGATPKESQQVIDILKTKPNYAQLDQTAKGVRDYAKRAVLDPLKEIGAISDEAYNSILKSNQFYTPFKRVMEEIETQGFVPAKANLFTPKAVPIKAIKGSEKAIIDPLESLISDTYKITDFVERERVAKAVVNLRKLSPELEEIIRPIAPKMVPVARIAGESDATFIARFRKEFPIAKTLNYSDERILKIGKTAGEKMAEEQTIFRPSIFAPAKDTIQVFENGARKFYQVDEDLAKAMNGMSSADMGVVLKILSFPAKTLRAGATLTPEFIGRNPIRDQMSAFVYSKYGYIPGVDLVKGIWETVARKDVFQKWLAAGGDQSMFVSLDRISTQKTLQEVVKDVFTPQRALLELKKWAREPLRPVRALSAFGEKGTRLGAFKRAVGKTSDIEAAFESRDITLDFSRLGSQTKPVNQIIAFWNANIQGLDKLVRAFKDRPIQTSLKAVGGITLPSIGLYLANRNNPRYQEIPQWQKDLFWIVIPPGEKSPIIRIPKPFELGIIFGTVPEHILAWIEKNDPEALKSIPSALSKGASPGYIPTALLPILENTANYSFFRDRPIVSQSLENLPPELQANTYTSETAKEIGKIMKYSPSKIENFANGYFGGLGRYALEASDAILKGFGIVNPPPEPAETLADKPFIKAFIVREPIGSASESVNQFYDILEKSTQAYNAAKDIAEKGNIDESAEYIKKHKEILFYKGLNKVAREYSEIRKYKQQVMESKDLTPEQKRKALDGLDTLMTEIAQQILIVINENK